MFIEQVKRRSKQFVLGPGVQNTFQLLSCPMLEYSLMSNKNNIYI